MDALLICTIGSDDPDATNGKAATESRNEAA